MAYLLNISKWIIGLTRETNALTDKDQGPKLLVSNLLGEDEQALWNLVTDASDRVQWAEASLKRYYNLVYRQSIRPNFLPGIGSDRILEVGSVEESLRTPA